MYTAVYRYGNYRSRAFQVKDRERYYDDENNNKKVPPPPPIPEFLGFNPSVLPWKSHTRARSHVVVCVQVIALHVHTRLWTKNRIVH